MSVDRSYTITEPNDSPSAWFQKALALCAIGVLSLGIWRWSVLNEPLVLRWSAAGCFGRLLGAAVILTILGALSVATAQRFAPRYLSFLVAHKLPFISSALLSLIVGQVACVVWIFLRSGISGVVYALTGFQLPITLAEVGVVTATMVAFNLLSRSTAAEPSTPPLRATRWRGSRGSLGVLFVLTCALLPLSLRELPRSIALSSDPDQHAYWAHQVLRLGLVPWHQGMYGTEPFGYPAGFAVLNAVWMFLSGLTAVEIVTVQPMIQCMLAILLCAASAPIFFSVIQKQGTFRGSSIAVIYTCLLLILCYWFIIPFGNQTNRYLGSGTARLSTTALSAIIVLGGILVPSGRVSCEVRKGQAAIFALITALLATFNPMSALLPLLMTLVVAGLLVKDVWRASRDTQSYSWLRSIVSVAVCVSPFLIILCEPYFVKPLLSLAKLHAFGDGGMLPSDPSDGVSAQIALPAKNILAAYSPSQAARLFLGGTGRGLVEGALSSWFALAGVVVCFVASWSFGTRFLALIITSLSLLWFAEGVSFAGSQDSPLYLIQPYAIQSLWDLGVLFGFLCVFGFVMSIFRVLSTPRAFLVLSLVGAVPLVTSRSIAQRNQELTLSPRVDSCGSFGCVTDADRETLGFVKEHGRAIIAKYPTLEYARMPKVLILGHPAIHGPEKWIFPYGASRIVPLESPLPVAFFYGQGSKAWSYENYMQKVCTQFDRSWLKAHNIRYLFLPESNPGCMRGKERVLAGATTLFQSGTSRFLEFAED